MPAISGSSSPGRRGLEARWARHEQNHRLFIDGLQSLGLGVLPPDGERLWTLNTVKVPEGIVEADVRKVLLNEFSIEVGAGLGPLAGKIWRVGLMGLTASSTNVLMLLAALMVCAALATATLSPRRSDFWARPASRSSSAPSTSARSCSFS